MKTVYLFLSILLSSLFVFSQTATLPAGSGTQLDPYRIATLNNLYWIVAPGTVDGQSENARMTKYYIQTANIDASATSGWESGAGWRPIGNSISATTRFTGSYHGQGYTITGLYINRPALSTVGFFGLVSTNAIISYVSLINVSIVGKDQVGGLVGYIEAAFSINNCYTTGSVSTVAGNNRCGGLIGIISATGTVSDCYSTCSVSTNQYGGGLIGEVRTGTTITRTYATGNVQTSTGYSGGLIGYTQSAVSNSYARGNVTCTSPFLVGGLIGYSNGGAISNCYSTGSVPTSGSWLGGLTGYCSGTTTTSYFDSQTSGIASSHTGTAKTTAELTNAATFGTWDFATIWHMTAENAGYPHLEWQNYVVLPVTLKMFYVKANGTQVRFNWETTFEQNLDRFLIQMSNDGRVWRTIHTAAASGNSNGTRRYEFLYEEKIEGHHFYKLQMVDMDGKKANSSIAEVIIKSERTGQVLISNPVTDGWMDVSLSENSDVQLYYPNGSLIKSKKCMAGNNRISMHELAPGMYVVRAGGQTFKLIKQ